MWTRPPECWLKKQKSLDMHCLRSEKQQIKQLAMNVETRVDTHSEAVSEDTLSPQFGDPGFLFLRTQSTLSDADRTSPSNGKNCAWTWRRVSTHPGPLRMIIRHMRWRRWVKELESTECAKGREECNIFLLRRHAWRQQAAALASRRRPPAEIKRHLSNELGCRVLDCLVHPSSAIPTSLNLGNR